MYNYIKLGCLSYEPALKYFKYIKITLYHFPLGVLSTLEIV